MTYKNSIGANIKSKTNKNSNKMHAFIEETERRVQTNKHSHAAPRLFADGVDHINVHSKAQTPLGRALAFDARYVHTIPKYGNFESVFSLFTWLTTQGHPNFLRTSRPDILRAFVKKRTDDGMEFNHPWARYICAYVLMDRIKNDPTLADALIETGDAPIASYYVANGYRVSQAYSDWWIPAITLLRSQLQAELELQVDAFSEGDIRYFEDALIPLEQAKLLGNIRKQPVRQEKPQAQPKQEKQPKQAKKVDKEPQEPKQPKPAFFQPEELSIPSDPSHWRIFGIRDKSKAMEASIKLLQFPLNDGKILFESTRPDRLIPLGLEANDETTPDDAKAYLHALFDANDFRIIKISTLPAFPDPFFSDDSVHSLEAEDGEDVLPRVKLIMGVSGDTELNIRYPRDDKQTRGPNLNPSSIIDGGETVVTETSDSQKSEVTL